MYARGYLNQEAGKILAVLFKILTVMNITNFFLLNFLGIMSESSNL